MVVFRCWVWWTRLVSMSMWHLTQGFATTSAWLSLPLVMPTSLALAVPSFLVWCTSTSMKKKWVMCVCVVYVLCCVLCCLLCVCVCVYAYMYVRVHVYVSVVAFGHSVISYVISNQGTKTLEWQKYIGYQIFFFLIWSVDFPYRLRSSKSQWTWRLMKVTSARNPSSLSGKPPTMRPATAFSTHQPTKTSRHQRAANRHCWCVPMAVPLAITLLTLTSSFSTSPVEALLYSLSTIGVAPALAGLTATCWEKCECCLFVLFS